MSDPATLAFYEREAPHYARAFDRPSRHLDEFLDRLTPGARMLELGCGGGRDAARMTERGFAVDATDGSAAMVRQAGGRGSFAVRQMRFDQLAAVAAYDAVWANACLIHVPRADCPAVFAAIRRALKPGGWHFASFKLGIGEGRDPLGRLTNFPDAGWLRDSYCAAGFVVAQTDTFRGEGADGVVRDWCALTMQVRA